MARSFAAVCAVSVLLLSLPAAADEPNTADALFDRGVEHMEAKRFEKACPLFAESYRLDPQPGALFTLAECEALREHLASAVARYEEYLTLFAKLPPAKKATQGDRERRARTQVKTLQPLLPQLTLELPPSAPWTTVVTLDGAAVAPAALGGAMPVDPGEHVLTAQVPGGPVVTTRVTIEKGEKKPIVLEITDAPPPPTPSVSLPAKAEAPRAPDEQASGKPWAIAGGFALATVGLGVGVGLTIAANAKGTEADGERRALQAQTPAGSFICGTMASPANQPGCASLKDTLRAQDQFTSAAAAGYVVGGVAAVGTVALLLLWPRPRPQTSGVRIAPAWGGRNHGVFIVGSF